MNGKLRRLYSPLAAAAIVVAAASPAAAGGVVDPVPITPNQAFNGLVNGATGVSRIAVNCDGPTDVVPTGHPVAGQVFTAVQADPTGTVPGTGFTGSAGTSLVVSVRPAGISRTPPVTLRFFQANASIPTDLLVPCSGEGTVSFVPSLTSSTARAAVVKVVFVSKPIVTG
jgi:hypothetical protein